MLKIELEDIEYFDPVKMEFVRQKPKTLMLEHSLKSIAKWESVFMKPFLGKQEKSDKEILYYIMCMGENITQDDVNLLQQKDIDKIEEYISSPRTATIIRNNQNEAPNREIITSELIYYWMIANNIPFECENWALNRLLTLINICNIKNSPPKKQSTKNILSRNASINAARRKAMNSKG